MATYAAKLNSSASLNAEVEMERLSEKLGEKIRAKRKEQGTSQDRLALDCGLDRSYMGRTERGEVNITVEKLYQIAGALNCHPSELLP